ncbi:hypothetical protein PO124_03625 [Bacillus licheniformis]|nr:hypothetical protein [Bacillus licheniformis]
MEYGVQSYYNPLRKDLHEPLWKDRNHRDMVDGLKSDVYLRSIGSRYSSMKDFPACWTRLGNISLRVWQTVVYAFEDIRIEESIKRERPGTKQVFSNRKSMYRKHFATQLTLNLERSILQMLVCAVYLKLTAESPLEEIPAIHESVDPMKGFIEAELARVFEARSTADIVSFVNGLMEGLKKCSKRYAEYVLLFPELDYEQVDEEALFQDLKQTEAERGSDAGRESAGDEEVHEEEMPTWHRETEAPAKAFSSLIWSTAQIRYFRRRFKRRRRRRPSARVCSRNGEADERKDYSNLNRLNLFKMNRTPEQPKPVKKTAMPFGDEAAGKPSNEDILDYQAQAKQSNHIKTAQTDDSKTLEHKKHSREPICMQAD